MERRTFLKAGLRATAVVAAGNGWLAHGSGVKRGPGLEQRVASDFLGFGYEMSSVARPGLLSVENTRYVNLLGNLGRQGVLRFGGIVADYTSYEAQGRAVMEPKRTVVNCAALEQLRAFLDRTGWTAIWSVNFGQGTLEQAVVEAREVASVLGRRLAYLELGNEVDNYGRGAAPVRKPPYRFTQFRAEYLRWHSRIIAAVPGLRFAAPDTADSVSWLEEMAKEPREAVQLLTTHYYRNAQQQGSAEQLTYPDPALAPKLRRLHAISGASGLPWRMCETNSFSGGGLSGVSDTLLGALWTLEYLLELAAHGCSGVNLETGVNQLGFVSSYSPIQDDEHGINSAGAPYYGMLAFAAVSNSAPAGLVIEPADTSFPGPMYRFRSNGRPWAAVVVNRDTNQSLHVPTAALLGNNGQVWRLKGEHGLLGQDVSFGGAPVRPDGRWSAAATEECLEGSMLEVPPASAAVVLARESRS